MSEKQRQRESIKKESPKEAETEKDTQRDRLIQSKEPLIANLPEETRRANQYHSCLLYTY